MSNYCSSKKECQATVLTCVFHRKNKRETANLCSPGKWVQQKLFCSLAALDPRVGHTMDTIYLLYLFPFIPVLCHWLTLPCRVLSTSWCCPSRPCVAFLAYVYLALFLALSLSPGNSLVSSRCDHSMLASLLWWRLTFPSLLQLC